MARVGRPAKVEQSIKFTVYLPKHVHEGMLDELRDDTLGTPRYGSRSALVTQLVSDWLRSRADRRNKTTRVATAELARDMKDIL